ncbi:MAG TPA: hypothetical protein G4O13_03935 [Dehalococcoidia bacterium]|nr:hypothetical protein [Dehalococcoidia bacterium]
MDKKRYDSKRAGYEPEKAAERRRKRSPFVVFFECMNCQHRWDIKYPKAARVREGSEDVILLRAMRHETAEGDLIRCPGCGGESVRVTGRERID